jgi:hypothetical protein
MGRPLRLVGQPLRALIVKQQSLACFKNLGGNMRLFSQLLLLLATSVLGGCAITQTPKDRLGTFGAGETTLYVLNRAVEKDISKMTCDDESEGREFAAYAKREICPNLKSLQIIKAIYYTHPLNGIKVIGAFAPASMNIDEDDILELSVYLREDGSYYRPTMVRRIAAKSRDSVKDCAWVGGKGATTAFLSGGVVCDGWDFKTQKFAQ